MRTPTTAARAAHGRQPAARVLAGDLSGLETAEGWPHEDTLDAIRTAVGPGPRSLVWLVTLDGVVIGDCGTVGPLRAGGEIEIGYGLAAEHRGRGYGTEVVAALSRWLRSRPGVTRVVAEVQAGMYRPGALERAGFELERSEADGLVRAASAEDRGPAAGRSRRLTRLQAR